jgi:Meiotically Up-regulated Gene 113 (MUG113) protein
MGKYPYLLDSIEEADFLQEFHALYDVALMHIQIEDDSFELPALPGHCDHACPGYVYLLRAENDLYKIGRSKNPKTRINGIIWSFPIAIELVVVIEATDMKVLEKSLHDQFRERRQRGEWFSLTLSDVEYIKRLASS